MTSATHPASLGTLLADRAAVSGDREAFVDGGRRFSFREIDTRATRFASFLLHDGLRRGDRLALCCKNGEALATAFLGAAKAGVIAVLVNWRLGPDELEHVLADSGTVALMYDEAFAGVVGGVRAKVAVKTFIATGGDSAPLRYEDVVSRSWDAEASQGAGGDDPAVIMYTSGTTGKPKGAVLSHANLFWAAQATSSSVEWNRDDRFLLVAPMFHIGGLLPLVIDVLEGCATVFLGDFDPARVWSTIQAERITSMMSVPLMLQAMLMVARTRSVDASSLRTVTCGASAVPAWLIDAYRERGVRVRQVYGITELGGSVTFWTHEMDPSRSSSQGKPVMHMRLRVVAFDTLRDVPAGTVGEVVCSGPMQFSGYWRNPEATRGAIQDGWYRTGDAGYLDEQGYLFVVERLKDMIISGGENIYPAELERVLAGCPGVAEVAVVGQPDPRWGEIPVACVVRKPDAEVTEAQLVAECRRHLASYKCIKGVRFLPALPKSAVGKVLKRELRAPREA